MNIVTGKKRNTAQIIGEKGINVLRKLFPSEWVVREYTPDYGIDIAVEIFERYKLYKEIDVVKFSI